MHGSRIGFAGLVGALLLCSLSGSPDRSPTPTIATDKKLDATVTTAPGTGYALSGHVRTNEGAAVPHITIELIPPGHGGLDIFADTGSDGSYGLAAAGHFTVLCITPNPDYACGPTGGDGNPYMVDTAGGPQRIDFILCDSQEYPECLSR